MKVSIFWDKERRRYTVHPTDQIKESVRVAVAIRDVDDRLYDKWKRAEDHYTDVQAEIGRVLGHPKLAAKLGF